VERAAVPRGGFAIVDEVTAGSPAALGGFVVGDLIVSFGDVSGGPLTQLASVLQASENREYQEDVLLCLFFFLFKNLVNCVL
jgi:26S proteasome non-ATPase regulatory subunit 9